MILTDEAAERACPGVCLLGSAVPSDHSTEDTMQTALCQALRAPVASSEWGGRPTRLQAPAARCLGLW